MAYDSLIKWVIPGLVFRYFRLIKTSFEETNVQKKFQVKAFYFISKPFKVFLKARKLIVKLRIGLMLILVVFKRKKYLKHLRSKEGIKF